jgi:hypothetical protein
MTPQELKRAADRAGKVTVATEVTRLSAPSSTAARPFFTSVVSLRLDAEILLEQAQLTPGLAATLRTCITRSSTSGRGCAPPPINIPRFLHCYLETIDGGLILPSGTLDAVTSLAAQAGSRLNITDHRCPAPPRTSSAPLF